MGDVDLKMMELGAKGYCCSQILVLLALEDLGRDNADLVRAASGLCSGLGNCSGTCGVYTGSALLLGLYAGKGEDTEDALESLAVMLESFGEWFVQATSEYGGTRCSDILGGDCGQPNPAKCGGLVAAAYEQVRAILVDNGLDPSEARDAGDFL